jgi:lysyl-tRNA synthetase class 2
MSVASNFFREKICQRAQALCQARSFFSKRNIIEVDCLALCEFPSIDLNIDLFLVPSHIHGDRFLFSSPEYQMKRMLAHGSGDIFYLGHVWRHEEAGKKHSPEFLMAEWYRCGFSFEEMIQETIEFIECFTGKKAVCHLSYREAFIQALSLDPFTASQEELIAICQKIEGYPLKNASKDDLLNLLMGLYVEPSFDKEAITVISHYPASQAALAQHIHIDGHKVAERFEIYHSGLELANGFHELADHKEQRTRFLEDNRGRESLGKEAYPIDEHFLHALEKGLPDCCGVAVGMDRLFMIQEKCSSLHDTIPLSWHMT